MLEKELPVQHEPRSFREAQEIIENARRIMQLIKQFPLRRIYRLPPPPTWIPSDFLGSWEEDFLKNDS